MVNENFMYKSPTHVANLNDMRLSGKLCDVTVKVDNKELRAHKVILAANLKYFESMFLNAFQESKKDVISMEDVDGSDLETFVNYAYTGEMLLTKSNALGLLELADYLNEDAIKQACVEFLKIHLDARDAFRVYNFANSVGSFSLKNAAKLRIQSNFGDCSQTTEYLNLDFVTLKDVMKGNECNDVNNTFESQQPLFEGIMKWIMHDPKSRRLHLNDLLGLIDVTKLAAGYLVKYLGSKAHRSDDEYGIVKDMMSYHHRCSTIELVKIPVKDSAEILMLLGKFDGKRFFYFYDFMEKKWSSLQEIPNVRGHIYSHSAILRDRLYYIGDNSSTFTLEVFNPTTNETTTLKSSDILWDLSMCACNKFIYLCGGRKGLTGSHQILRYDPQTNCIKIFRMTKGRYAAGAIFFQGHLHVLGGRSGISSVNLVEKYNSATENWTAFPSMIVPRAWHAVAALDEKLYACGGYNGNEITNKVEVYEPAKNSWQLIAYMNKKRHQFVVVAREGKLWAIGGDTENTVEVYDPNKNQWQMDDEMSSGLRMQNPAGGLITASCIFGAK